MTEDYGVSACSAAWRAYWLKQQFEIMQHKIRMDYAFPAANEADEARPDHIVTGNIESNNNGQT